MKTVLLSLFAILATSSTYASGIRYSCSNRDGVIKTSTFSSTITILETTYPEARYAKIAAQDVNESSEVIQTMPTENRGCSSRTVTIVKLKFTKKDGTPMPNAYNKLANEDGSLEDYFICSTDISWMPGPQGCK